MKELKSMKEIENYIYFLEKQSFSQQNTHAYRVGMAIMKFYDKPNISRILGLKSFIEEVISATRKNSIKNFPSKSKICLSKDHSSLAQEVTSDSSTIFSKASSQYYFVPTLKDKRQVLVFGSFIKNDIEHENNYSILTPNNYINLLRYGNYDEVVLDLNSLVNSPMWRGFGTYDDIIKTNRFLELLHQDNNIYKVLVHQNNLALFPIILDRISIFDNVLIDERV